MAKLITNSANRFDSKAANFGLAFGKARTFDFQPESYERNGGITSPDYIDYFYKSADGTSDMATRIYGSGLAINENGELTGGVIHAIVGYTAIDGLYEEQRRIEGFAVEARDLEDAMQTATAADDEAILAVMLSGNDLLELSDESDYANGFGGNDAIYGNGGDDTLEGGEGNDILDGGSGQDVMFGGRGNDTFIVDSIKDRVSDDTSATSTSSGGIDLVRSTVDWSLEGTAIDNLTLLGNVATKGSGNALNNVIRGNTLNNELSGDAGDDRLDGGKGNDSLIGGNGSDTYVVDSLSDVVEELGTLSSTFDTIETRVNWSLTTKGKNVENLKLLTGAIEGIGNTLNNQITGNSANNLIKGDAGKDILDGFGGNDSIEGGTGNDTINAGDGNDIAVGGSEHDILTGGAGNDSLSGEDGNDTLDGGTGVDTLDGGSGNDTYVITDKDETIRDASGVDTVQSYVDEHTLLSFLEKLELYGSAVKGTGNALANTITVNSKSSNNTTLSGGDGNDTMTGSQGNDNIDGGTGSDTLNGMSGDDTLTGGIGNDSLSGGDGTDSLVGGEGNDTIAGGFANDQLQGGAGNDSLDGGSGSDTMAGGDGNDIYFVDTESDVTEESAGVNSGIDTVQSKATTWTLLANIENLTLDSSSAIKGLGNNLNNTIFGSSAANLIEGYDGNDSLAGGSNNDTLIGGAGNDLLDGGTGNDSLTGGIGNDVYVVDSGQDTVIEAADGGTDTVEVRTDLTSFSYSIANLANIENLATASSANQTAKLTLEGNSGANLITGSFRQETLKGGAGSDTLTGGGAVDSLDGGDGSDLYRFSRTESTSDSGATGTATATTTAAWGVDVVSVTNGDRFDFGVTEALDSIAGSNAISIAIGTSGKQSSGGMLSTAMGDAINETSGEAFLFSVTDRGSNSTFSGMYLVYTSDSQLSGNDVIIKIVGVGVDSNDTITIADGNVVYNI